MKVDVTCVENEGGGTFVVKLEVSGTSFGQVKLVTRVDASTFSAAAENARQGLFQFASDLAGATAHAGSLS